MITLPNTAYYLRLQQDAVDLVEVVDLALPGGVMIHWTTCNQPITYTLSGAPTQYLPFPGAVPTGIEESSDLGVNVIDFVTVNTGEIKRMLDSEDFALAGVKIGRVFASTPDLGRAEIYNGQMGDFSYNRNSVKGQARNAWKSLNVNWPYYTYREKCVWRFGSTGCGFNTSSITRAINSINVGSSTNINLLIASGYLTQSYSNGRFDFGRATITGGANSGHMRTVRVHTGDMLMLSHPLPNSDLTGLTLSIYPGCNKRLIEDCRSLYSNDKNFLGFPWIVIQENAF